MRRLFEEFFDDIEADDIIDDKEDIFAPEEESYEYEVHIHYANTNITSCYNKSKE